MACLSFPLLLGLVFRPFVPQLLLRTDEVLKALCYLPEEGAVVKGFFRSAVYAGTDAALSDCSSTFLKMASPKHGANENIALAAADW